MTQNNLQLAKNRTANEVKPISKMANEHYCPYLGKVSPIDSKKLKSAKNSIVNAVKPVSKTKNERFRSYLVNGISDQLKIACKVLKIDQQIL